MVSHHLGGSQHQSQVYCNLIPAGVRYVAASVVTCCQPITAHSRSAYTLRRSIFTSVAGPHHCGPCLLAVPVVLASLDYNTCPEGRAAHRCRWLQLRGRSASTTQLSSPHSVEVIDNNRSCASMDDGTAWTVCSKQHSLPCSAEACRDERTQNLSVESFVVLDSAHGPTPACYPYVLSQIRCCSCRIDGVASLHGSHHTTTSAIAEVLIYQAFAHLAVTPGVLTKLLCHKWQRSARPWFRYFTGP